MLNRERVKLADQHRGIKDMRRLPDAVIVVDANFEGTAIREATSLDIPVVAIVDTNTDPLHIDYPIPANDDSIRTIQLIMSAFSDVIIDEKGFATVESDGDDDTSDPVNESVKATDVEKVESSEDEHSGENIEALSQEKSIEEEE